MYKLQPIVVSVLGALAIAGCASLEQFSDKAAQVLARPEKNHADMTAEQLYRLGKNYQAQGSYDQAIAAYVKALERDHAMADAHNALGVTFAQQGRYDDAVAELKAAIELKPGQAYMHNNLGFALLLQGADREALYPLEIALHLEPGNEKAAFNLRLAHERLGDLPQPVKVDSNAERKAIGTPQSMGPATGRVLDARLVALGPGVYELKPSARVEPEITPLRQATVEESASPTQAFQQARRFRLEISNGNGTPGLARQVARMLNRDGIHTKRITNHATFRQTTTQIQYQKGYLAEASALSSIFPAQVTAVANSSLRSDIQVRILLGKDASSIAKAYRRSYASAPESQADPVGPS